MAGKVSLLDCQQIEQTVKRGGSSKRSDESSLAFGHTSSLNMLLGDMRVLINDCIVKEGRDGKSRKDITR